MPVLGADPEQEVKEWDESPTTRVWRVGKDVYALTQYFAYHPRMKMSQRHDATDTAVLNRLFSKRLKQGYSEETLRLMVDRFYQSWAADSNTPALVFSSNKVQDVLRSEADVAKTDPVLNWMLMGMPDRGPFDDSKGMRKALLLDGGDALFRCPELVADILRREADVPTTSSRLRELNASLDTNRALRTRKKYDTVSLAIASIPLDQVTW